MMAAVPDGDLRSGAEIIAMVSGLEELTEQADRVNYRRTPDRPADSARKILFGAFGLAAVRYAARGVLRIPQGGVQTFLFLTAGPMRFLA